MLVATGTSGATARTRVASFTERERGALGDPRVVVGDEVDEDVDRHRDSELGRSLDRAGAPRHRRRSQPPATRSELPQVGPCAPVRRGLRRARRGPLHEVAQTDGIGVVQRSIAGSQGGGLGRTIECRVGTRSATVVHRPTVANVCHFGAPRRVRSQLHGRLESMPNDQISDLGAPPEPVVPGAPAEGPVRGFRWRRWMTWVAVVAAVVVLVLIIGSAIRLPYYTISPGSGELARRRR